jgi:hypothetical protein
MKQYTNCELFPAELEAVWELIKQTPDFVAAAPRAMFIDLLDTGRIQLWAVPDALTPVAIMITELQETTHGRIANVLVFAGQNVDYDRAMFTSIKKWAYRNGCSKIRAVCRDAQTRLFTRDGFVKVANVIELEVHDE